MPSEPRAEREVTLMRERDPDAIASPGDRLPLPTHLEETVQSIARLHADHAREASLYQRSIERLIDQFSRPAAVAVICGAIACWVAANLLLMHAGRRAFDAPPFPYLEGLATVTALVMTVLILTSQRHENRLAERRAQLTLEFAMVAEQKIAKVIELLDAQRRGQARPEEHADPEAAAMAKPADAHAIFHAVKETHDEMLAGSGERDPGPL
jgi:uncharacterized membrane protein